MFLGPNNFDAVLICGFVAAVLGGLDSPPGAVVGGLVLGLALSYVSGYEGSALVPLAALVILVLVLMVRPRGLFSASRSGGLKRPPRAHRAPVHARPRSALLVLGAFLLSLVSSAPQRYRDLQWRTAPTTSPPWRA